ncbi:MAG: metal-dependent hydrolase [Planctomycetaceae bacterium]|nr:metal-dependent hydrolase [Planctomycetaceae bacterium]
MPDSGIITLNRDQLTGNGCEILWGHWAGQRARLIIKADFTGFCSFLQEQFLLFFLLLSLFYILLCGHLLFIEVGNFRQHITCSTVTGILLGGVGYSFGVPLPACLLSAGLCGIAGMFPDIDSDTSRSFQECIYLAAGIAAVMFVQRLRQLTIEPDIIMLGGGAMFLFVRFGVGGLVKKTTSHRGLFHSIPAAVFAGQITYFLLTGIPEERLFKAFAVSSGYFSHLILDEICSVDSNGRVKKSFGTALKWFEPKKKRTTLVLYAIVIGMGITVFNDPEANGSAKQFISDNTNAKLTGTINEVKETFKTVIQQEAAAYLNKERNKESVLPVAELLSSGGSVLSEDHDLHLFSRRQTHIGGMPDIADGLETGATTVLPQSLPPETFGTGIRNRGSYRNFVLPNREPATVILP